MTASELRIGNWVMHTDGILCRLTEVDPITSTYVEDVYGGRFSADWKDLRPIELTPKVLEKCGFEYDKITYSLGRIWVAESIQRWDVFLNGVFSGVSASIHFLHQLQNLFYALTGTELNYQS